MNNNKNVKFIEKTTTSSKMNQVQVLAIFSAFYTALALGFSPIIVRLSEIGPFSTAFYRFFLSLPVLWIWMVADNLKQVEPKVPQTPTDYLLILGAGVFLAGDLSFWYLSMLHTTIINATLLNNLTVVLVPLLCWVMYKEKPSVYLMMGIGCTLLGSCILIGHSFQFSADNVLGDMYAFTSAFFYAIYMVIVKRLRQRFTTPTILAWSSLPTLYIFAVAGYMNHEHFFPQTSLGWIWLFGLAIIVHVMGQGLLTYAMAHLSASLSALILSSSPIFAAIFAWIIVGESLTLQQILGAVVVMVGIIVARETDLLSRLQKRKNNHHAS